MRACAIRNRRCRAPGSIAGGLALLLGLAPAAALGLDLLVVDGDTLVLDGRAIDLRTEAVDRLCPQVGEGRPCGRESRHALQRLVEGAAVHCEGLEGPRFGREIIATCWADGRDIGQALVRDGWARADRRYSSRYVHDEAEARNLGRGLWSGAYASPWD